MKLIVGLGNPGRAYAKTRHNIGFMILDVLAKQNNLSWKIDTHLQAEKTEMKQGREKIILLKPQTFMNRSGESVQAALSYYHIPLSHLLVIHDDADLSFEETRKQTNRSAAGHNGVQSIIDCLGGEKGFTRLRIGIGRGEEDKPLDAYVLGVFNTLAENIKLPDIIKKAAESALAV